MSFSLFCLWPRRGWLPNEREPGADRKSWRTPIRRGRPTADHTAAKTWCSNRSLPRHPFPSMLSEQLGAQGTGVAATGILVDEGEPVRRYSPGHPDADKDGYVAMPRVNPTEEMVDLMGASRGYQANVAAFSAAKEMIHRSIDLLKA